jgi:hypothetical protein
MRHESKHSGNVIECNREDTAAEAIADAPHSHPEVSFPHAENGEDLSVSADRDRHPANLNLDEGSHPLDDAGDLATIHEQHARQIASLGNERAELARRLSELARELAQARKDHAEEVERTRLDRDEIIRAKENIGLQLAHAREHHREQAEGFVAELAAMTAERNQLSAQLAQWRTRHQTETVALTKERDELSVSLDREREQRRRQVQALTSQVEGLTDERNNLTAELEQTRAQWQQQIQALSAERDALAGERDAIAAESARLQEAHKTEVADLGVQHDAVVRERYRLSSEFSTFREAHDAAIEALSAERDRLRDAQNELRSHLEVVKRGHQETIEEMRREHTAVLREADEMRALLETDRGGWRKQIALFTTERETLARERDEALAELARERQAEVRQVELRTQECGNLLEQRGEMLQQIDELRETQKRQNDLFRAERDILCEERDHIATKLARSMDALGEERVTLLQQKTDAEERLAAATAAHAQQTAALEEARVAIAQERDAALRELAVHQDLRAREETAFGTTATRKLELAEEMTRDGLRMEAPARDTALGRDVEVHMIHGGATSEERRAELIAEVRHLARLQHPNIPPIYEAGFDESGQVFYTTRAVAGMSLREVLDELERGKTSSLLHFSLRRLLGLFHRICDAIAYAHAREVAHGDLKPEHVILGEFGEVFVTGWRLPRTANAEGEALPPFHPRDDITALGRILYEMTNLLHPPEGEAGATTGATKASSARAWAGDKDVNALAAIAKRALSPKAAGRFYSVRELQMQVDAFKDSFDDPARVALRTILRHWVYRHRTALIVTAVLLVLGVAGGIWYSANQRPVHSEKSPPFRSEHRIELPAPVRPQK